MCIMAFWHTGPIYAVHPEGCALSIVSLTVTLLFKLQDIYVIKVNG